MKANETESSSTESKHQAVKRQRHGANVRKGFGRAQAAYSRAVDPRRPLLRPAENREPHHRRKKTRRVPLKDKDGKPVETVAQAVGRAGAGSRRNGPTIRSRSSSAPEVRAITSNATLDFIGSGQGAKKPGTVAKEKAILGRWTDDHRASCGLTRSSGVHVNRSSRRRLTAKAAPRTINLDVIALRVVLKRAFSDGHDPASADRGLATAQDQHTSNGSLFTTADLDKLCAAAFETKEEQGRQEVPVTENAQQFADYIKLMAYCGARRNEALGLQWEDVDFDNGQLHLRRQITAGASRT